MTSTMSSPTSTVATDESAVRSVLAKVYETWAAHDADAFADLYTADATVVMPGLLHSGREAVRDFMAAGFTGRLRGTRGFDVPRQVRVHGDTAIVVSDGGILQPGETEIPADRAVHATWVLVRQDGTWKIAAYANAPVRMS